MKYQIGQVAKLLDISAQGLRLYEKEGIVLPNREESGYRSYSRLDITSLLRARSYQKYGFSLQQINKMINTDDLEYLFKEYENHEEVLEKSILIQQLELNRLKYIKNLLKTFPDSLYEIKIENCPNLYRFEYMCGEDLMIDENQYSLLKRWISYAPLAFHSIRNDWNELTNERDVYYSGISMYKDDFDEINDIELFENAKFYESVSCITTIILDDSEKHNAKNYLSHVFEYIKKNNIEVIGDPFSESIVSFNKKEKYTRIRKIWIPIKN